MLQVCFGDLKHVLTKWHRVQPVRHLMTKNAVTDGYRPAVIAVLPFAGYDQHEASIHSDSIQNKPSQNWMILRDRHAVQVNPSLW